MFYFLKKVLKKIYLDSLQRNALYLIINALVGNLSGFIYWIIVARYYTVSEVGLASTLISTSMMIATVSNLGFGTGIIKYLPTMKEDKSELINSYMVVASLLAVVISLIFIENIKLFSKDLVFLNSSYLYSLLFTTITLCLVVVPMQDSVFIANRSSGYVVLKNLILGSRILFPLLFVPLGSIGIFGSYGIAYILAITSSTLLFFPRIMDYTTSLHINKSLINETFHFSIGNHISNIFQAIPNLLLPIVVTNIFGSENTAYFYVSWTIATILYVIPRSISTSLFAEGSHRNTNLYSEIIKAIKLTTILIIPSVLIIIIFSEKLLYIFGENYSQNATDMVRILSLSSLPLSINEILFSKWRIQKEVNYIIISNAFISLVTFGGGYYLVSQLGINSFGFSWLIANVLVMFVNITIIVSKNIK